MDELFNDMKERGLINEVHFAAKDLKEFVKLKEETTGIGWVEIEKTDTYHFVDFDSGELPKNIIDKLIERRN